MKNENTNTNVLEESLIEYQNIKKMMSENSTGTIKDLLSEAVRKELKNIITEGADDEESDKGEGLDDITPETGTNDENGNEAGADAEFNGAGIDVDANELGGGEEGDGMDAGIDADAEGEGDFDIDQFRTGEDEYDLTNHSMEDVVKVFKKIDDKDSIIVKKLDDGKIEINDKLNGAEYLIDLNGEDNSDVVSTEDDGSMAGEDADIDEMPVENTDEPVEDENLNESDTDIEIELDGEEDNIDEKNMTQSIGTNRRAGHMTQTRIENAPGVNNRDGAQLIKNESKKIAAEYNAKLKRIEEKYALNSKKINEEIQEYKNALALFRDKLKENAVLNNNLAKYVKIVTENATTKDEKVEILKRFSKEANTIEAGNKLFESINSELNKNTTPNINIDKQFNTTAPKKQVNEQVIYQSTDLQETIGLMKRMNKL